MAKKEKQKSPVTHKSPPKPKAKIVTKPAAPAKPAVAHKPAALAHKPAGKVVAKPAPAHKPAAKPPAAVKPATPVKPAPAVKAPVAAKMAPLPVKPTPATKLPVSTKPAVIATASKAPLKVTKSPTIVVPIDKGDKQGEEKPSKKNALRESILARKAALKPIAFTLEEVRAIAQTIVAKEETSPEVKPEKVTTKPSQAKIQEMLEKQIKPSHVQAASLADILGFNPKKQEKPAEFKPEEDVPEKYRKYYRLLIDMRKKTNRRHRASL